MPQETQEASATLSALIDQHKVLEGPLLPLLHAVQNAFGHVPEMAIPPIAEALNLSHADVHGVISFYHDFRTEPAGQHVLKICRAEACQALGGEELAKHALAHAGLDWKATSKDGTLTVEPVYCLGLCAVAPAALLDEMPIGRLDREKLSRLLQGKAP